MRCAARLGLFAALPKLASIFFHPPLSKLALFAVLENPKKKAQTQKWEKVRDSKRIYSYCTAC
jgi:hypothetical protein